MDLTIVLSTDVQTGMIPMLSNSLIEQLNVNRRLCHIAMKAVSADFLCSVVWWGARAACADVSMVSVEASKDRLGFRSHVAPDIYGIHIQSDHRCVLSKVLSDHLHCHKGLHVCHNKKTTQWQVLASDASELLLPASQIQLCQRIHKYSTKTITGLLNLRTDETSLQPALSDHQRETLVEWMHKDRVIMQVSPEPAGWECHISLPKEPHFRR
jgi:hypothetical protein